MMRSLLGTTLALTLLAGAGASHAGDFVGEIRYVGFSYCPGRWLPADGGTELISLYPELGALYGTTFGGDGITTFGLPDLRGRVPVHEGAGPGLTPRTLAETGGEETVTLTGDQIPSHSHIVTLHAVEERATRTDPQGRLPAKHGAYRDTGGKTDLHPDAATAGNTGGSQAHQNMPPFLVIRACISTVGTVPSNNPM